MARHRRESFVVSDDLESDILGDGFVTIEGNIRCLGSLYIAVGKRLRSRQDGDEVLVETVQYAYNGVVAKVGNLFRYNSPHYHRPFHHIHEYNVLAGDVEGTVVEISRREWPTLSQVIHRFRDWYYANLDALAARGLA